MSPWLWATAALLVAFVELVAPGMYLIWIALGAAITAAVTGVFAPALEGQFLVFAAASLASCAVGFFVYRALARQRPDDPTVNQRGLDLIGAHGTVSENFRDGRGKVRLGDSLWLAEGPDDLAAGAPVVVMALRGTTAIVERAGQG
jgi:membrane protein implicated in regulation of membrane protease activity